MTNIPTLTPWRFSSIKEITDLGDKWTYKSVRVMGKLISFDLGAYSATISDDKATMKIEISLIPEIELIINNRYEFLGDLRKVSNTNYHLFRILRLERFLLLFVHVDQ